MEYGYYLWPNVETTEAKILKSPNLQSLQTELYLNAKSPVFNPCSLKHTMLPLLSRKDSLFMKETQCLVGKLLRQNTFSEIQF